MPRTARRAQVSLLALAAVIVVGCGSGDKRAATAAGNSTDRAFVAGMVPHHEMGVEMARMASERSHDPELASLASTMVRVQTREIARMRELDAELASSGVKRGDFGLSMHEMGMEHGSAMLRTAYPFDREFLDAMVPHHRGAVRMAQLELDKGIDKDMRSVASSILKTQNREIRAMTEQRRERFGAPAGHGAHSGS